MATYIIGDVQGCFDKLQQLLAHISFNPNKDRLGFLGDLVNRGPNSLNTLRFIKSLKNPIVVLGNHDLFLLALGYGVIEDQHNHTLNDILTAPDKIELIDWLRHQPLLYINQADHYLMVHAGIAPQWSVSQAEVYANEVSQALTGKHYLDFLSHMLGDEPDTWNETLTQWDRLRYLTNAFTRMRFCTAEGQLTFARDINIAEQKQYRPWFEWRGTRAEIDILFGHWAALEGKCTQPHCYALDTGCVWKGQLTAMRIEDRKLFSV